MSKECIAVPSTSIFTAVHFGFQAPEMDLNTKSEQGLIYLPIYLLKGFVWMVEKTWRLHINHGCIDTKNKNDTWYTDQWVWLQGSRKT